METEFPDLYSSYQLQLQLRLQLPPKQFIVFPVPKRPSFEVLDPGVRLDLLG